MNDFLQLALPAQAMLFAGFIAHYVSDKGRGVVHGGEGVFFRVLGFGFTLELLARALSFQVRTLLQVPDLAIYQIDNTPIDAIKLSLFIPLPILIGAAWRLLGRDAFVWLMKRLKIYREDHEASAWRSLFRAKSENLIWVQLHTLDGSVYEAYFTKINERERDKSFFINSDGVVLPVTSITRKTGKKPFWTAEDQKYALTYFPQSSIMRVEYGY